MKIDYFRGRHPNFGDDLNLWLWPRLIPDFFDEDPRVVFLGIGSILGEKQYPPGTRKVVFGAGYVPEYHARPNLDSPDWKVYFVRGPRTARALGMPPELALGDPGMLVGHLVGEPAAARAGVSLMPHWESMERGRWPEACRQAGIRLIDPRDPVDTVIEAIRGSETVLCEAMHGAIVADALRVPWVPLLPLNHVHRNKWLDWTETLSLTLSRRRLLPSTLEETRLGGLRKPVTLSPFAAGIEERLAALAARRLRALARTEPTLSAESRFRELTSRMLEKADLLRRDYS